MNRTLWKLDHIGERLWILATMTATQAAALANEGKGLAVVAEETRKMANKVNAFVEKSMSEGEDLQNERIIPLALNLNLLALNSAIEANRLGHRGKQAMVCAEDIRDLAYDIVCLFDKERVEKAHKTATPWAKTPMSTSNQGSSFLLFSIGGIQFVENLDNIKEVCSQMERKDSSIILRNMELPLIDGFEMLGKTEENPGCVIVYTPWAQQNKIYAVSAIILGIFHSPIGKPVDVPADMPLAKYVRECWENENGEPFYFMDWTKMV